MPDQDPVYHLVPGSLLELTVLLSANGIRLSDLGLVVQAAVDAHVGFVLHPGAVNPPDLTKGARGATGDVHSRLEDHEQHEGHRSHQHDPLRVCPHLTHHIRAAPLDPTNSPDLFFPT